MSDLKTKIALDFGCGPGRMVKRMSTFFKRVDGVDISKKLVDGAKKTYPESNFYLSEGDNLGNTPTNTYDFVYSTIAIQHIAVHSIRMSILKEISKVLKNGGKFTLQMAFNADYPYIINKGNFSFFNYKFRIFKKDRTHALWNEDKITAMSTNAGCDATISYIDIPDVINDFEKIFENVDFWFNDVRLMYHNLNGEKHAIDYWPTHWIFISGVNTTSAKKINILKDTERREIWKKENNELRLKDVSYKNSILDILRKIAKKTGYYKQIRKFIKIKG